MSRDWIHPRSLQEALAVRAERGAVPLSGATDLLVRHRGVAGTLPSLNAPIVWIGHLQELTAVTADEDELRIGAAAVYTDIAAHPRTPAILRQTIAEPAAPAIRNVATVGGNIGNASPAADAVCTLYALDAEVELASVTASRRVPIAEVITGPGQTTIGDDELITAVYLPLGQDEFWFYRKVGTRRANALSKLALAACGRLDGRRLADIGLALGAVAPTVVRSGELEHRMRGAAADDIAVMRDELIAGYLALVNPIDDQRSTRRYRLRVTENLLSELFDRRLPFSLEGSAEHRGSRSPRR